MYDLEKQHELLQLLLGNSDLFAKCNPIIQASYFDPALKKAVSFIKEFFDEHRDLPNKNIVKAYTGIDLQYEQLSKAEQQFAAKEIEKFCQFSAAIDAVYKGPELIEKGNIEQLWQNIKSAATISLNSDLGLSYFENVEQRLRDLLDNSPCMPTGWIDVDDAIGGGICREELTLFAAASGVGKSLTMANLSINLIQQGYNGLYISLEMADRVVCRRFDSMVTGIAQTDIMKDIHQVAAKVEKFKNTNVGELFVKRMPESVTTANHIRAYLKEFEQTHSKLPDFIVVDYIDLMATNNGISAENIWLADKFKAEELRSIAFDFKLALITASQLGRASWEAEKIGQQHIQGGISKIQTCDIMIAIVQTDQMKAAGEYIFEYVKTRNSSGVGTNTLLRYDPISLRITSNSDASNKIQFSPKSQPINTILNNNNIFNSKVEKPKLTDLIKR